LSSWQDVAGSKVKATDFGKAIWQLARIYRRYPALRQERTPVATTARPAARETKSISRFEERTLEELIQ
jgi:hypothetical protein